MYTSGSEKSDPSLARDEALEEAREEVFADIFRRLGVTPGLDMICRTSVSGLILDFCGVCLQGVPYCVFSRIFVIGPDAVDVDLLLQVEVEPTDGAE